MPSALIEVPATPAPNVPPRKRWTREECASLEAAGLLDLEHLELIGGELIDKMGKNRPHVNALLAIRIWLGKAFGEMLVNHEATIDISPEDNPSSEPQPDVIVLNRSSFSFRSGNPRPRDLQLVVEVADSTLQFDLTVKGGLYARAGVVEYWVLDVQGRRLFVHRQPESGKYRTVLVYTDQESVAPLAAPQSLFQVAGAFPEM